MRTESHHFATTVKREKYEVFRSTDFCLETAEVLSEIGGGYCVNRMARKSAAIHLSEVSSTFNYIFVNAKLDFHVKLRLLKR